MMSKGRRAVGHTSFAEGGAAVLWADAESHRRLVEALGSCDALDAEAIVSASRPPQLAHDHPRATVAVRQGFVPGVVGAAKRLKTCRAGQMSVSEFGGEAEIRTRRASFL